MPGEVARLLAAVPQWFGQAESNAKYIQAARSMETWTVRDARGTVLGVLLAQRHYQHSAEIHLMVVDRAHHGKGIGTALFAAVEAEALAGEPGSCKSKLWGLPTRMLAMRKPVDSMKSKVSCPWRKLTCGELEHPA